MSIPIGLAGLVTALIAAALIGLITSIATLYLRLASLPRLQQETLEEVRLLRLTLERLLDPRRDPHQRWSP